MSFLRRLFGKPTDTRTDLNAEPEAGAVTAARTVRPPEPVVQMPVDPMEDTVEARPAAAAHTAGRSQLKPVGAEPVPPVVDVEHPGMVGTRPLPPLETIVPQPGQRFVFGIASDVGMVRGNNQDAGFAVLCLTNSNDNLPDFGVFMVADGMGGHQEGERASAIAVRLITRYVLEELFVPLLDQRLNDPDRPAIADVLRSAVQEANDSVTVEIPEGGTTATIAVLLGDLVYVAHVGDSRAYMIVDDGIEQITRDHSLVQRLIELDQLTPEEAAEHPQRNVLYKALGQSDSLEVDTITRRMLPRSRLLLCSDGLWNLVPEDTILEFAKRYSHPQEVCRHLVKLANERGGPDNITVVMLQAPE